MNDGRPVERERTAERDAAERPPRDEREAGVRFAGLRRRVRRPHLPRPRFSVRAVLVATALAVAGVVLGGLLPVLGTAGRFVGLFVATFVYGLVAERSHYAAVGVGGALAAGVGFVLQAVLGTAFVPVLAGWGPEIAGVGATAGLLVALAGHYFGRDLRGGLTRAL